MGAMSQQTIIFDRNILLIKDLIRSYAFSSDLRISMKSENPESWGTWYRFHHGATIASYGEKITIYVTPLNSDSTKVEVVSECAMPTQIIDYGKNAKNVAAILKYISKNIPLKETKCGESEKDEVLEVSCPECGKKLSDTANFCSGCGHKLEKKKPGYCPGCGAKSDNDQIYCTECGKKL